MSVVNLNPSQVQVIQSTENRQKISSQQGIAKEEAQRPQAVRPNIRDTASSEQIYAEAWSDIRSQNATDPRTALYAGVRDLERNDSLKQSLNFSVYA